MTQSATRRALGILELLLDQPQGLGLSELGSHLGMPKSVAHRLLALLIECGFVRQDAGRRPLRPHAEARPARARYHAGTGLGTSASRSWIAWRRTGELVRMAVVESERMAWVGKAQGARHGLRYDPDAGTRSCSTPRRRARRGSRPWPRRGGPHHPGYRLSHAGPFRSERAVTASGSAWSSPRRGRRVSDSRSRRASPARRPWRSWCARRPRPPPRPSGRSAWRARSAASRPSAAPIRQALRSAAEEVARCGRWRGGTGPSWSHTTPVRAGVLQHAI